jgi:hypothetical protein
VVRDDSLPSYGWDLAVVWMGFGWDKSHPNPIQITAKSHPNLIPISYKSHSKPIQIPSKSHHNMRFGWDLHEILMGFG